MWNFYWSLNGEGWTIQSIKQQINLEGVSRKEKEGLFIKTFVLFLRKTHIRTYCFKISQS